MSKERARLVKQWEYGKVSYRLISLAHYTPGYDDEYVLERAEKDALGGRRWVVARTWDQRSANDEALNALAEGCK
jgi:hypothetical protein